MYDMYTCIRCATAGCALRPRGGQSRGQRVHGRGPNTDANANAKTKRNTNTDTDTNTDTNITNRNKTNTNTDTKHNTNTNTNTTVKTKYSTNANANAVLRVTPRGVSSGPPGVQPAEYISLLESPNITGDY